jgi:hypothetical protein
MFTSTSSSSRPPRPAGLSLAAAPAVATVVALLGGCAVRSRAVEPVPGGVTARHSKLWGVAGELFHPDGRLMDWSHAGYRAGEAPLPERPATIDAGARGAKGDGRTDTTLALRAALGAARPGDVVHLPAGTYVLRDELDIPAGVVLEGEGPDRTVLEIPVSLTDLRGNRGLASGKTSDFAFGGAFIRATGRDDGALLATVVANAARGTSRILVSSTAGIEVGQWVHVEETDVGGTLTRRLHAELVAGGRGNVGQKQVDHYSRVRAVRGGAIELERPLTVDLETRWSPRLLAFVPRTAEVGVQHLTIHFPDSRYGGHFKEAGYNAIEFAGLFNSWIRDVRIVNADYGVNLNGCRFVTVRDVVIGATDGRSGHHALNNSHGGDNLFIGFDIRTAFVHDLTNEWYGTGVVFTRGKGLDLSLDHHRAAPYLTLWTELDVGRGTRVWKSGGAGNRGPHTAAYDTVWNVRGQGPLPLPPADYGPRMNLAGIAGQATAPATSGLDWSVEAIPPALLEPANLWVAMRAHRGLAPLP